MRKIVLITMILLVKFLIAQNNLKYYYPNMPSSPSSSTFLKYGDISNNEYTGTNNISLPIYTIKSGRIDFPLSLDYISGNGIRVDDEGSTVGIGWNIGLPAIVQTVYGIDDFDFEDSFVKEKVKILLHYQPTTPWGLLNYNNKYLESREINVPAGYVDQPQIGKYTYYYSTRRTVPIQNNFVRLNNGTEQDASADIFTLNIFGKKIQFFILDHQLMNSQSTNPFFECLTPGYDIKFDRTSFSFTVTAPNGVTYIFGKTEKTSLYQTLNRNFVLTQIIDRNNNSVFLSYNDYNGVDFITETKKLNYTRDTYHTFYPECGGIPIADFANVMQLASRARPGNIRLTGNDPFMSVSQADSYAQSQNVFQNSVSNYLLIKNISWRDGELDFSYGSRNDKPTGKLDYIKLLDKNKNAIKDYRFEYDQVTANNNYGFSSSNFDKERMTNRLFLKKLVINGIETFLFEYKSKELMPRKDSYAVDYWGYFNGGETNKTYFLYPKDFNGEIMNSLPITSLNNNKKLSDINFVTSGLLNKIIYPTKGYSQYFYEENSASNLIYNSSIQSGKGVRLLKQLNYDLDSNLIEQTEFSYLNGYTTNPLNLVQELSLTYPELNNDWTRNSVISMNSTNNYNSSILSSGDFIGYKEVTKKKLDRNGNSIGKIVTNYSVNPDVFYQFWANQMMINIPSTKAAGIENGKILSQTIYNADNEKLKEISNSYNTVYTNIFYNTIFTSISEYIYICIAMPYGGGAVTPRPDINYPTEQHVVAHFPLFGKESLISSSKTTEFFDGKELITKESYTYDNYNLLNKKIKEMASGDIIDETVRYTSELSAFLTKNILSDPLENAVTKNNRLISKNKTSYGSQLHFNPISISSLRVDNPSIPEENVSFDRYDSRGNLRQYRTKDGLSNIMIWGYNDTYLIAKVVGATYPDPNNNHPLPTDIVQPLIDNIINASNDDAAQLPGNDESALLTALDNFRKNSALSGFQITTYTYDPLIGVRSITSPNGIRENYIYDTAGRLKEVKDTNGRILKENKYNYKQ